jgi:hypothetical protein
MQVFNFSVATQSHASPALFVYKKEAIAFAEWCGQFQYLAQCAKVDILGMDWQ